MKKICETSLSHKRWLLRECEEGKARAFTQKLNLSFTLARLLVMGGHTIESASLFLTPAIKSHLPDPLILKDMEKAVGRLLQGIKEKEKIVVWGDYDVDGATSTALLCRFFKSLNIPLALYIPDRVKEGYGPNRPGIQKFIDQGYTLMVMADCGTTAFEVLQDIQGLDIIILDHHAAESKLPDAYAIVNPNRLDEGEEVTHTLGHLAAVGISFLCVVALNRALREAGFYKEGQEPNLMALLDLVALGTVCDVMPLRGLNRTFVAQGLKIMRHRKNIGIRALYDKAGLNEAPTPYHLGFVLGPRVNAGGRVGESFLGTRLLSTDNPEEASKIAQQLDHYNQERRLLETEAVDQALRQVDPDSLALVVDKKGWHEGIIGIVAGRLKEKFHKPTAVITWRDDNIGKASARSIPGFDFGRFIHRAHRLGYVLGGGGHAMAAGFSLEADKLPLFKNFLEAELVKLRQEVDFKPTSLCDGYLDLRALTPDLLQEIEAMAPFGMGNPSPKFIFADVMVDSYLLIQDQHIRCRFSQGDGVIVEGIGFRLKDSPLGQALMEGKRRPLHLLASPKVDTWGGKSKITLMIEDAVFVGEEES